MDENYIKIARELAQKFHSKQFRRDGQLYFTHLEAVAKILEDRLPEGAKNRDEIIAAAFLHDSQEDQGVKPKEIVNAGLTTYTSDIIQAVSRRENETYFDFIIRIKNSGFGAIAVKLADLEHNMSDLNEGSLKDKYRFARHILRTEIRD